MARETGKRDSSILTCIRDAYGCLWHFRFQHILISLFAFLPFCLAGFLGYLDAFLVSTNSQTEVPEGFYLSFIILMLTTFAWLVPSVILWHRLFLLGPEHLLRRKFWPLITRSFHFSLKILVFLGVLLVLLFLIGGAVLFVLNQITLDRQGSVEAIGNIELAVYLAAAVVLFLLTLAIGLRLSLAFSAQSIGKRLGFRSSWDLTRSLTGHMLLSVLAGLILPVGLVLLLRLLVLSLFGLDILSGLAMAPKQIFILIFALSPLMSLPLAYLCSQTSVFYRNCGAWDFREPS
ncbi:hypothetical protein [Emcibacter nanhaiensis]|uniref:Glycerophosphoryl diester phosphodiesterase membrane domain-containing protein n=1 Tax=Emcibacter nanhaiensis TaxID=1505037 RepID=A0A501PNF8_9PROT|nr:hypothetical protein [Emcibacter nanhaiensis]TPD61632.1 hypothetical protein FIV46_05330 [Emcibacter nanhaiensis]